MGYSLIIGELEVDYINSEDDPYISLSAKGEKHDDAPAFGEPTDHTNQRWPSYRAWNDFAKEVGLTDLFYGHNRDDILLQTHPGCVPLTESHRREINAAMSKADLDDKDMFWYNARLQWLHYWVNWALDNCEKPVFANS